MIIYQDKEKSLYTSLCEMVNQICPNGFTSITSDFYFNDRCEYREIKIRPMTAPFIELVSH